MHNLKAPKVPGCPDLLVDRRQKLGAGSGLGLACALYNRSQDLSARLRPGTRRSQLSAVRCGWRGRGEKGEEGAQAKPQNWERVLEGVLSSEDDDPSSQRSMECRGWKFRRDTSRSNGGAQLAPKNSWTGGKAGQAAQLSSRSSVPLPGGRHPAT